MLLQWFCFFAENISAEAHPNPAQAVLSLSSFHISYTTKLSDYIVLWCILHIHSCAQMLFAFHIPHTCGMPKLAIRNIYWVMKMARLDLHISWLVLTYSTATGNMERTETLKTRMWANAQPDGRPAEHRWRPLFNAAKFGWRPLLDAVQ